MTGKTNIEGKCGGCNKPIIWMRTLMNRLIPCNPESVGKDDTVFDRSKHITHFATCPKADKFRKHHYRSRFERKAPMTAEQIEAEREKIKVENQKRFSRDKRPFIVNNQFQITSYRYALLNRCAELGMGYEELISKDNHKLMEWLVENREGTKGQESSNGTSLVKSKHSEESLFN